ncbi:caspase domain containing protein [Nitzschia inconspicua]|uniref:Caspase domain containing protein n=1 Tax=Nitzschia inconspicua TaxID=303405 RepID=A0A9K3M0R9_9STRA|nr:caspase domain containing protein [Nitzschia inconspicua]
MGFLNEQERQAFEQNKPQALRADIWMVSGCEDHQTSADVSNTATFQLPDSAGRAGGACTAALLNVLYEDEKTPWERHSFAQVMDSMRANLRKKGFSQVPQLSSTRPIDMNDKFHIVPEDLPGIRRAVLVGINYRGQKGELRGCHNDVFNMYNYLQDYHGFQDADITVLVDDGDHGQPTKANILAAYHNVVRQSRAGDAIFLHFSGHGTKVRDQNGDEDDGYDEAMVPLDFKQSGLILDDDLYDIFVKGLPAGVHVVAVCDCCHSGTIMDLPYVFKANGEYRRMEIEDAFDFNKILKLFGGKGNTMIMKMGTNVAKNMMKQFFK